MWATHYICFAKLFISWPFLNKISDGKLKRVWPKPPKTFPFQTFQVATSFSIFSANVQWKDIGQKLHKVMFHYIKWYSFRNISGWYWRIFLLSNKVISLHMTINIDPYRPTILIRQSMEKRKLRSTFSLFYFLFCFVLTAISFR